MIGLLRRVFGPFDTAGSANLRLTQNKNEDKFWPAKELKHLEKIARDISLQGRMTNTMITDEKNILHGC